MPGINVKLTFDEIKAVARIGATVDGPGTPRERGRRRVAEIVSMIIRAEFRYDRILALMREEWRSSLVDKRQAAAREVEKLERLVALCDEGGSPDEVTASFSLPEPPRRDAASSEAAGERDEE